ncbi:unnamed protein product [Bursaphelenchus okinawaensis]|uniref:Peptidase A1 domain-containing protein n=1 Tax=Bursaphelenchus okinawaensis TaxID=465554 RepID=A0A811KA95_9BILA|nr:unnamed protein product [Bursaphelenchus okinawaensis]CAG9098693.1 unnamed protein product [Bursaphelenchus okinawaensis]
MTKLHHLIYLTLLFLLLPKTHCTDYISGPIADFYINVTFPGWKHNERSFIIDTRYEKDFIWDEKSYSNQVGYDNTYNPDESNTHESQFLFKDQVYIDGQWCRLTGRQGTDYLSLLPYKNVNWLIGSIETSSCGTKPTNAFNNELRAGVMGFINNREYNRDSMGYRLVKDFQNPELCLHKTTRDDRQADTVVAVGATLSEDRVITSVRSESERRIWSLILDNVVFNNTEVETGRIRAIIDPSYRNIDIPTKQFDQILRILKPEHDEIGDEYYVDCWQQFELQYTINNSTVTVPSSSLMQKVRKFGKDCHLLLSPTKNALRLGVPFFFDNGVCLKFNWEGRITFYDASFIGNSTVFGDTFGAYYRSY